MSSGKKILKIAAPFFILITGVAIMSTLVASREAPQKIVKQKTGALVRVTEVKRGAHKIVLIGTGTAQPARAVTIVPQVSGRLTFVSDSLVRGGIVSEGKVLMKIEDVDYRLSVERAKAAVVSAEFEVAKVEGEARVARATWKSAGKRGLATDGKPKPLTVFIPQLKKARAELGSAKAALAQERVNLGRTVLRAPFNAIVRSESVELGQFVRVGTEVASLTGTDSIEILVPIKVDDLEWIDVPVAGSSKKGSHAGVSISTGGRTYKWHGSVVRSLGEVDPNGRMNRVIVRVEDPYGLKAGSKSKGLPPLAIGSFVNIKIDGATIHGVFNISRSALRDSSTVWIVEDGSTLKIRKVKPVRVEAETVVIKDGLADGDLVVITDLTGAANGMLLRTVLDGGKRPVVKRALKSVTKEGSE